MSDVVTVDEVGDLRFFCPACRMPHRINLSNDRNLPVWQMTGTKEEPSIYPSVKVSYEHWTPPHVFGFPKPEKQEKVVDICHTQITNGQIFYYQDSTHPYAGQTVKMIPVSEMQALTVYPD